MTLFNLKSLKQIVLNQIMLFLEASYDKNSSRQEQKGFFNGITFGM